MHLQFSKVFEKKKENHSPINLLKKKKREYLVSYISAMARVNPIKVGVWPALPVRQIICKMICFGED